VTAWAFLTDLAVAAVRLAPTGAGLPNLGETKNPERPTEERAERETTIDRRAKGFDDSIKPVLIHRSKLLLRGARLNRRGCVSGPTS